MHIIGRKVIVVDIGGAFPNYKQWGEAHVLSHMNKFKDGESPIVGKTYTVLEIAKHSEKPNITCGYPHVYDDLVAITSGNDLFFIERTCVIPLHKLDEIKNAIKLREEGGECIFCKMNYPFDDIIHVESSNYHVCRNCAIGISDSL